MIGSGAALFRCCPASGAAAMPPSPFVIVRPPRAPPRPLVPSRPQGGRRKGGTIGGERRGGSPEALAPYSGFFFRTPNPKKKSSSRSFLLLLPRCPASVRSRRLRVKRPAGTGRQRPQPTKKKKEVEGGARTRPTEAPEARRRGRPAQVVCTRTRPAGLRRNPNASTKPFLQGGFLSA